MKRREKAKEVTDYYSPGYEQGTLFARASLVCLNKKFFNADFLEINNKFYITKTRMSIYIFLKYFKTYFKYI